MASSECGGASDRRVAAKGVKNEMAKPKVTATDQLSNVIEVVELGQRTGMLLVERGSGSVLEEGEIYFIRGRAVYASMAGLRGREALAALGRWGSCRFAFDREALRPDANLTNPSEPAIRAVGPQSPVPGSRPSWPAPGMSQPGYYPPQPGFDSSSSWPTRPSANQVYPQTSGAAYAGQYSGPAIQPNPQTYAASEYPTLMPIPTPPQLASASYAAVPVQPVVGTLPGAQGPNPLQRRPRRAPDVRELMNVVTAHNLSRSHRTVLLLSDGEHTVEDLSRLSSKPLDEVAGLLDELESRGLVYYFA